MLLFTAIKTQVYCNAIHFGFLNVRPLNEIRS